MAFNSTEFESCLSTFPVLLAIDPSPARLDALKEALGSKYAFHAAVSGVEGFRTLQRLSTVDILLVNGNMAPVSGIEFLRILENTISAPDKIIKVLFVENGGRENPALASHHGHIDLIYDKPFRASEILSEINRLVAHNAKEKRSSLRVSFPEGGGVYAEFGYDGKAWLSELSENGMFIPVPPVVPEGLVLPFLLHLSDNESILIDGRVARIDPEETGFAVEFLSLEETSRSAIFRFLSDRVSLQDLSELKKRYPFLRTEDMVVFRDGKKISSFFENATKSQGEITAISPRSRIPVMLQMESFSAGRICTLKGKELDIKFKTSDSVFISFQHGYATYNFETTIRRIDADGISMECFFPRVVFYSEKRAVRRTAPEEASFVEIFLPAPFNTRMGGPVVDISDGGASFISGPESVALLPGTPLESIRIMKNGKVIREERGEVRNVLRMGEGPGTEIRYGIQFGIGRLIIQASRAPEPDKEHSFKVSPVPDKSHQALRRATDLSELAHTDPEIIHLENSEGEDIIGLLNTSFPPDRQPIPVIVIPPAFGKTKETLFALALTIVTNFHAHGKQVGVLRFDGIRRKGESHKDLEASEPPLEMLNATFSQGASDLKAIIDWLHVNPKIKPGKIILISFSLSALDVRLILRDETYRRKVDYWIACMGTPEFRDLMIRVNCGLDFFEHYQLGIPMGVMPVLGNLVNVDAYVADGVRNELATLDQARKDMSRIDIPITWIYGEHDHWVKAEFIRDVMGVHAEAPRDVIPVPIGHNARTSEDALQLFGTITSLLYRHLHQRMLQPIVPDKKDMNVMRRAEKDRLPQRNLKDKKEYWQRYLIGEENLVGFDVMSLSDDYLQLMKDQLEALDLKPEDRLLDLGGGTGNFIRFLLESDRPFPANATIADLIPKAINQAHGKLIAYSRALRKPAKLNGVCLDLEADRFLPVRRYYEGEVGRFVALSEQIENLPFKSAEKIDNFYSKRLHRILRGEKITPELDRWLRSQFELAEYRIILDFNQACRFVRGRTKEKPSFRQLQFPGNLASARHLPFRAGYFNKILMSLVLSYIFNPVETLLEIRRIIGPEGRLVLSSMRPDTDASGLFTRLMAKIEKMRQEDLPHPWNKQLLLDSIRSFLNDAQALVDLEESGTFDFFDPVKLEEILNEAGWDVIRFIPSFGTPPQGYVVEAKAR